MFTAAGSGFSTRIINAFGGISEDQMVSSTGSYNATATLTVRHLGDADGHVPRAADKAGGNPAPTVTCDHADVGYGEWRDRSDDHGYGLPGGRDGKPGRDGSDATWLW